MHRIGILYKLPLKPAEELAHALQDTLTSRKYDSWLCPAEDEDRAADLASGSDLIITVGGDGTILRAAQVAVPLAIPILGVNMGRLGFMTEMRGSQALEKVPKYLTTEGWIEERAMLEVEFIPREGTIATESFFPALNDVVVGRGAAARVAQIQVHIDGVELTTYRADAVIVSTATGSTGYAFASGGPILYPESRELLLVPVAAHVSLDSPLVLHPDAMLELRVRSEHQGMLSVDGQVDYPLKAGNVVRTRRSSQVTRFLRAKPPSHFYATLTQRLSGAP